jgi:hypothetical protein
MRYFLAILAIIISYVILSGIIVGIIFKGNVYGGGGLLLSFIMIPVAIFLWKAITRKKENKNG